MLYQICTLALLSCAAEPAKVKVDVTVPMTKTYKPAKRLPVGPACVSGASVVTSTTQTATVRQSTFTASRKHRLRNWHPFQNLRSRLRSIRGC